MVNAGTSVARKFALLLLLLRCCCYATAVATAPAASSYHAHRCAQQERVSEGLGVLLSAFSQRVDDKRAVHLPLAVGRRASPGLAVRVSYLFSV